MGKSNNNKSRSGRKVSFRILFYVFLALFIAFVISNVITLLGYLDVIAFKIEQRIMNNIRSNIRKNFKKIKNDFKGVVTDYKTELYEKRNKTEDMVTNIESIVNGIRQLLAGYNHTNDKTKINAICSLANSGMASAYLTITMNMNGNLKDPSSSTIKKNILKALKNNKIIKNAPGKFEVGDKINKDIPDYERIEGGSVLGTDDGSEGTPPVDLEERNLLEERTTALQNIYPGLNIDNGISEAVIFIIGLKLLPKP